MKKNRMMRLATILLVCVLLTTSVISGTFAKYTSTASIEATSARVAKWEFTLEGNDITDGTADSVTLDLFKTVLDTKNDADETDVDGDLIAPGTYGKFTFDVANTSEVNATYSLALTATVGTLPIEFSTDGGTNWKTNISDLDVKDKPIAMKTGTDSVTVQWRWAFEGADSQNFTTSQTDESDTTLGRAATGTIYVKATVTATQVD